MTKASGEMDEVPEFRKPFINPKGLAEYRIDNRPRGSGPDETEGRMIYRARANAEGRMQVGLTRQVKLKKEAKTP